MKTYYYDDESFMNTDIYSDFMKENPGIGYLTIRAYAASGALPISGIKIVITKIIDETKVIFFEGITNESGIISNIKLPAPKTNNNDLEIPVKTNYEIEATYEIDNFNKKYNVGMYNNIYVIQNIIVVPKILQNVGGLFGN